MGRYGFCDRHQREMTGFTTLFCPDCVREEELAAASANKEISEVAKQDGIVTRAPSKPGGFRVTFNTPKNRPSVTVAPTTHPFSMSCNETTLAVIYKDHWLTGTPYKVLHVYREAGLAYSELHAKKVPGTYIMASVSMPNQRISWLGSMPDKSLNQFYVFKQGYPAGMLNGTKGRAVVRTEILKHTVP